MCSIKENTRLILKEEKSGEDKFFLRNHTRITNSVAGKEPIRYARQTSIGGKVNLCIPIRRLVGMLLIDFLNTERHVEYWRFFVNKIEQKHKIV
jgi:hypothetical protein